MAAENSNGNGNGRVLSPKLSSLSMDRLRGPSQVAWKTPTSGSPSPSSRSWALPNRLSSPLSPGDESPGNGFANSQKASLRRMSSDSLHLHSIYLSDIVSDTDSVISTQPPRPLSPIDERLQFPDTPRPSSDSVPPTPESGRVLDGHLHSAHPAFLNRPLNRTISQTSTSTFCTTTSLTAPSIPPLDLRPNFAGSLGVPRKSNLAAPSLPTVIGSPRPNVSVIYEDSVRSSSFITAPSVHVSESDVDLEEGVEDDLGVQTERYSDPFGDGQGYPSSMAAQTQASQSHMSLSEGLYDIDLSPNRRPPTPTPSHSWSIDTSVLDTMSRRSVDSDSTKVESAITNRWRRASLRLSFGSFMGDRDTRGSKNKSKVTSACILFWLGFIAPWCWLIGGWYLSRSGEMKPDGQFLQTVSWKWPRKKWHSNSTTEVGTAPKVGKQRRGLAFWTTTREHVRSQETLPMSPIHSTPSTTSMRFPKKGCVQVIDPWVSRCRVAAVTSGILLLVAVIIAVVVATRLHA
ncbi:hypothetical protein PHLCEN_2v6268 [Hermanssonia centrifuga]|uniref:Uncharacterized protein n=1 Tax=Hermanssonia centrifuga TaxID=98765 RepID=A0A2R6NZV2_9APHY|nr:hypothetical protein PHLCEN_2v6268 [Hermanssonia centrifuga]